MLTYLLRLLQLKSTASKEKIKDQNEKFKVTMLAIIKKKGLPV